MNWAEENNNLLCYGKPYSVASKHSSDCVTPYIPTEKYDVASLKTGSGICTNKGIFSLVAIVERCMVKKRCISGSLNERYTFQKGLPWTSTADY